MREQPLFKEIPVFSRETGDKMTPLTLDALASSRCECIWYVNHGERLWGPLRVKGMDEFTVTTNVFVISKKNVINGLHQFFDNEPIIPWNDEEEDLND